MGALGLAILMLAGGIEPASAQRPRDSSSTPTVPARTETPAPAPRTIPSITAPIHGTNTALPLVAGHCQFDESNSFDKNFSQGFRETLAQSLLLVRFTYECQLLQRGRTSTLPPLDSIAYLSSSSKEGPWTPGTRRDATNVTCKTVSDSLGSRLNSRSAADRVLEANQILAAKPKATDFFLFQDLSACYSVTYTHTPGESYLEFLQVQIFTRIRGNLIIANVISSTVKEGERLLSLPELFNRAQRVVADLETLNNERR